MNFISKAIIKNKLKKALADQDFTAIWKIGSKVGKEEFSEMLKSAEQAENILVDKDLSFRLLSTKDIIGMLQKKKDIELMQIYIDSFARFNKEEQEQLIALANEMGFAEKILESSQLETKLNFIEFLNKDQIENLFRSEYITTEKFMDLVDKRFTKEDKIKLIDSLELQEIEKLIKDKDVDLELKIKMIDRLEARKLEELEKSNLTKEQKEEARKHKIDFIIELFNGRDLSSADKASIVETLELTSSEILELCKHTSEETKLQLFDKLETKDLLTFYRSYRDLVISLINSNNKANPKDLMNWFRETGFNEFMDYYDYAPLLELIEDKSYVENINNEMNEISNAIKSKDKEFLKKFLCEGNLGLLTYDLRKRILSLFTVKELIEIRESMKNNKQIDNKISKEIDNKISEKIKEFNFEELLENSETVREYYVPGAIFYILMDKWELFEEQSKEVESLGKEIEQAKELSKELSKKIESAKAKELELFSKIKEAKNARNLKLFMELQDEKDEVCNSIDRLNSDIYSAKERESILSEKLKSVEIAFNRSKKLIKNVIRNNSLNLDVYGQLMILQKINDVEFTREMFSSENFGNTKVIRYPKSDQKIKLYPEFEDIKLPLINRDFQIEIFEKFGALGFANLESDLISEDAIEVLGKDDIFELIKYYKVAGKMVNLGEVLRYPESFNNYRKFRDNIKQMEVSNLYDAIQEFNKYPELFNECFSSGVELTKKEKNIIHALIAEKEDFTELKLQKGEKAEPKLKKRLKDFAEMRKAKIKEMDNLSALKYLLTGDKDYQAICDLNRYFEELSEENQEICIMKYIEDIIKKIEKWNDEDKKI